MPHLHQFELRVRYYETDGQGYVHHANFIKYFEVARVEQLLASGFDYADVERDGVFLVVKKLECNYVSPARFGDSLQLSIETIRARGARIDHIYHVHRGETLVAEGKSTLACIDREGRIQRLPDFLQLEEP